MEKEQREEHGVERVVQEGVGTGSRQVIEEVDAAKVDQKWQMVNGGGIRGRNGGWSVDEPGGLYYPEREE